MKSISNKTQLTVATLLTSSTFSLSALAHNGEHTTTLFSLSSIAQQITHLFANAGHIGTITLLAACGLVLTVVAKKIVSKKTETTYLKPIRCER